MAQNLSKQSLQNTHVEAFSYFLLDSLFEILLPRVPCFGIAHARNSAQIVDEGFASLNRANDWSARLMSTVSATSPPMQPQVWTLDELSILNEISKPVAVIASGVYESPHR